LIVSIVRFRSKLSAEEVLAMFEERSDRYRSVPGLIEKLYLRSRESDEFGAIYVWESEDDLKRFRQTDLARTIPDAYQIEAAASFEIADVCLVVQPDRVIASR
jgi:heme-degrading monooxygenase HmoA